MRREVCLGLLRVRRQSDTGRQDRPLRHLQQHLWLRLAAGFKPCGSGVCIAMDKCCAASDNLQHGSGRLPRWYVLCAIESLDEATPAIVGGQGDAEEITELAIEGIRSASRVADISAEAA
jgi:hypothetical protein